MNTQNISITSLLLLVACFCLCSCNNQTHQQLANIDSLLNKELEDSAANQFEKITSSEISKDEDKAYYALLSTRLNYRQGKPIKSDSTIDYAINYYEKEGDNEKLADCYYYKGSIYYDRGNPKAAIENLKRAEYHAKDIKNLNIKHKIPEMMMFINQHLGESKLSIEYGKKALELSKGNNNWTAFALGNIAIGYNNLGMKDSSNYYFNKCYPLLKYIPSKERIYLLYGVANDLAKYNPNKCIEFLKKNLDIQKTHVCYNVLSDAYINLGKYKESLAAIDSAYYLAPEYVKQDILEKKMVFITKIYLAKEKQEEYSNAQRKRDSIKSLIKEQNILSLQKEYDYKIEKIQNQKEITYAILISTIVMLLVLSFILYQKNKLNKRKRMVMEKQALIEKYKGDLYKMEDKYKYETEKTGKLIKNLKKDLDEQEQSQEQFQHKINSLRGKIGAQTTSLVNIMTQGKILYDSINKGENTLTWKKSDFEKYIEYYKLINIEIISKLENNAEGLSPKQLFYSILFYENKTEEEIEKIMCISSNAYRTTKTRIKAKIKDKELLNLLHF